MFSICLTPSLFFSTFKLLFTYHFLHISPISSGAALSLLILSHLAPFLTMSLIHHVKSSRGLFAICLRFTSNLFFYCLHHSKNIFSLNFVSSPLLQPTQQPLCTYCTYFFFTFTHTKGLSIDPPPPGNKYSKYYFLPLIKTPFHVFIFLLLHYFSVNHKLFFPSVLTHYVLRYPLINTDIAYSKLFYHKEIHSA